MAIHDRKERRLLSIGYLVGVLLAVTPLLEIVLTTWPPRPGTLLWRWAAVGILSQALVLPLVGFSLAAVTAWGLGHWSLLKALAVSCLLGAVLLLASSVLYALDALDMLALAEEDQTQLNVEVTGVRVLVSFLVYAGALSWLAWSSLGVARSGPGVPTKSGAKREQGVLIVGKS